MTAAAFILGLTGSLHCMAMCGMLALHAGRTALNSLLYHAGRILTYMLLGGFAAAIGRLVLLADWMGWFSIVLGIGVLIILIVRSAGTWLSVRMGSMLGKINRHIGVLLRRPTGMASCVVGLLNGLLPCGWVYAAMVLAMVQPDCWQSVTVMMVFGLGTVPALLILPWVSVKYVSRIPITFNRIHGMILFLTASLLIWRGASLLGLFSAQADILCSPHL
jgi:sulfite exporter TauE/SafE